MQRINPIGKAAWTLVFLCLLVGAGGPELWAGEAQGGQLVLVLDLPDSNRDARFSSFVSQSAALLVNLMSEGDYLGLAARLNPDHRDRTLKEVTSLTPAPGQAPLMEVLKQALGAFDPTGPAPRALVLITEGSRVTPVKKPNSKASETQAQAEVITQAREAEVAVFTTVLAPMPQPNFLKNLTAATGGRLWEFEDPSALHLTCLRVYECLEQPQQIPIKDSRFLIDPWVNKAVVVASRSAPGKEVVLASPSGRRITSRTRAKNIRWSACQSYDLITITQPQHGLWSLTQAWSEEARIFLTTELKLLALKAPREVGEDEALQISALLKLNRKVPLGSDLLEGTNFTAALHVGPGPPIKVELKPPDPDVKYSWPTGARVGTFPALRHPGEGTIVLLAQGVTFQRQVSCPLIVGHPWFRTVMLPGGKTAGPWLRFQPAPDRQPEELMGTVTLKTLQGTLGGALVNPAPGAEITLTGPTNRNGPFIADLHLTGTAPGGRPLVITSTPTRLDTESQVTANRPPSEDTSESPAWNISLLSLSLSQEFRRRGLWLGLIILGLAVFLTATLLFIRQGRVILDTEEEGDSESSENGLLKLKDQVEALTKEKSQLQVALEEMGREISQLKAEKADLEADLSRLSEGSQDSLGSLEESEKS